MLTPNEKGTKNIDKVKLYGWQIADKPGEILWLNKTILEIDNEYQRDAKDDDSKVLRIASEWSWIACGALIVANRRGRYYVIDGHHRVRAAMKRSDIEMLPCVVFESTDQKQEAEGFIRANKNRKPMSAVDSFRALLMAGNQEALMLESLVRSRGLRVGPTGKGMFSAPGAMLDLLKADPVRATHAFNLAADICNNEGIHQEIIRGLFALDSRLNRTSIQDRRVRQRLLEIGRTAILDSIAKAKAFRGVSGSRVWAEGIFIALNHRLRNKFEADF